MSSEKWRILFVDDEINMLKSLRRVLRAQQERWHMDFESDPNAAIEMIRREPYDIVVSDLRMPGLSGLEMIEKMKFVATGRTEYILLTGNADLASAIDAINKTGVFRFLTKPCETETLIDAVDVALASIVARSKKRDKMATAALSAMSPAVAVVDRDGQIVYFNESADDVLKTHDGITVDRSGALVPSDRGSQAMFREALFEATQNLNASPKFVRLSDALEAEPLTAVIMPVDQDRAAIMFTVPGRFDPPSTDSLVELFGLSRVEATLAQTIASGGTVEDAATNCKVTVETARTYLKRIFQKVGVRRQVDLVQLILTTPATLIRSRAKAS